MGCSSSFPRIDLDANRCTTSDQELEAITYATDSMERQKDRAFYDVCMRTLWTCSREFVDRNENTLSPVSLAATVYSKQPDICRLRGEVQLEKIKEFPRYQKARVSFVFSKELAFSVMDEIRKAMEKPEVAVFIEETVYLPDEGKHSVSPSSDRNLIQKQLIKELESRGFHAGIAPVRLPELPDSTIASRLPKKLSEAYFERLRGYGWDAVLIGTAKTEPHLKSYFEKSGSRGYRTLLKLGFYSAYGVRKELLSYSLDSYENVVFFGKTDRKGADVSRRTFFKTDSIQNELDQLAEDLQSQWQQNFLEKNSILVHVQGLNQEQVEALFRQLEEDGILAGSESPVKPVGGWISISGPVFPMANFLEHLLNGPYYKSEVLGLKGSGGSVDVHHTPGSLSIEVRK